MISVHQWIKIRIVFLEIIQTTELNFEHKDHDVDMKIEDFFSKKQYKGNRCHNLKLELPKNPNTDIGRNAFSHRVIIPWNSLPHNVINSNNVKAFKWNDDMYIKSSKTDLYTTC